MPADSTAPTKALADFFPNQRKNLPIALTTEDVKGKTYVVTGATGGIGYELAKHLVRLEAGKVIIGARSEERGKAAKATIESDAAGGRKDVVEIWPLDLASYESVKAFGKRIETVERVDALVLNAGVSHAGWQVKEGNESHLTVNFISNYLLAFEALPHMQAVARTHGITPRLVVVGSMGAFFGGESIKKFPAEGILDDLNDRAKWESDFTNRYTVTKLLEHMAARQLASLRPVSELGVVVNVVDPGFCKTGLNKELSLWTRAKAWFAKVALGRSAEMGSRTLVHAVKAGEESHGKYLTSCEIREDHIPEWVTNETGQAIQKQIWDELLVKLDKIEPGLPSRVIADWA